MAAIDELLPIHPATGFAALGLTKNGRPIWPIIGAAEDDDDSDVDMGDDDGDDEDDNSTDSGSAGGGDTYTAPSQDEWSRTQAALAKANANAKKHRLENRKLKAATSDEPEAVKNAKAEGSKETEGKYKPALIRHAAKAELAALGAPVEKPEKFARLIKLIDMEDVDVDDDGEISGLTEQVKVLRQEWPELFGKIRAPKGDAGNRQPPAEKKTSAQVMAERAGY